MVSEKQIEAAADQISEGLGAFLRKFCDSEASKRARHYLHEMPKDEWNQMALMLATEALTAAEQSEPNWKAWASQLEDYLQSKGDYEYPLIYAAEQAEPYSKPGPNYNPDSQVVAEPTPTGRSGAVNEPVPSHWPEAHEVADIVAGGKGFWRSCSGCHELNEGHPNGPWSVTLGCNLGCGCYECGGIGAVWDTTDYADMGEALATLDPAGPATDAEPVAWISHWSEGDIIGWKKQFDTPRHTALYTRPPENRLREALEEIANGCDGRVDPDNLPCRIARSALAQGADDERS